MGRLIFRALPFLFIVLLMYKGSDWGKEKYFETKAKVVIALTEWEMNSIDQQLYIMYNLKPRKIAEFAPFIEDTFPDDPEKFLSDEWGTEYQYSYPAPGGGYELRSAGPDLEFQTEDDLVKSSSKR